MKIHIVIPAAGLGTRFKNSKFNELKPFIKFKNKTMLEHLILNIGKHNNVYISIIILKNIKKQYQNDILHLEKKYPVKFYYIDNLSEGTTATALHLYDKLNNDNFTLLMNCDQIVDISLNEYIKIHNEYKADGSLLCFTNESSKKWSYVKENNNIIKKVVAKNNISDIAVCGWYAWSKGKDFIKYGIMQIIHQDKVNGEYYLCPIYNYAIKDKKKIVCIKIKKEQMHGIGTAQDLENYLK